MIHKIFWCLRAKDQSGELMCLYRDGSKTQHSFRPDMYRFPRVFNTFEEAERARIMRKRGIARKLTKGRDSRGVVWSKDSFDIDNIEAVPFRWVESYAGIYYILVDEYTDDVMPECYIHHRFNTPKADVIPRLYVSKTSAKMSAAIWKKAAVKPWGSNREKPRSHYHLKPIQVAMEYV